MILGNGVLIGWQLKAHQLAISVYYTNFMCWPQLKTDGWKKTRLAFFHAHAVMMTSAGKQRRVWSRTSRYIL